MRTEVCEKLNQFLDTLNKDTRSLLFLVLSNSGGFFCKYEKLEGFVGELDIQPTPGKWRIMVSAFQTTGVVIPEVIRTLINRVDPAAAPPPFVDTLPIRTPMLGGRTENDWNTLKVAIYDYINELGMPTSKLEGFCQQLSIRMPKGLVQKNCFQNKPGFHWLVELLNFFEDKITDRPKLLVFFLENADKYNIPVRRHLEQNGLL
jgi:hypothetical protein